MFQIDALCKWGRLSPMSQLGHSLQGRMGGKSSNVRCTAESGSKLRALAALRPAIRNNESRYCRHKDQGKIVSLKEVASVGGLFHSPPRTGTPSPTSASPCRLRSAARTAACRSVNCFRVAGAALSAIRASAISRAVIGACAIHSTSSALRYSVPRLNHGLDLLRRLADIVPISKSRRSICNTASTCIKAVRILIAARLLSISLPANSA
jgi:hypothetical protein